MPVAAPTPYKNFARRKRYDQAVLADNPTHYWKLNEKSGTLCADVRGTQNATYLNVTLDQPNQIADKDGAAVKFSTVAVEGQATTGVAYGTPVFPFTVEAWVSIPDGANSGETSPRIFDTHGTTSNYYGVTLSYGGGGSRTISINYGDGAGQTAANRKTYVTTSQVPVDTPTHIVAVCTDFNTVDIYFNGVLQGQTTSGTGASISYAAGVVMIGRNRESGMSCEFDISNVATYDGIALTQAQIQHHFDVGHNFNFNDNYRNAVLALDPTFFYDMGLGQIGVNSSSRAGAPDAVVTDVINVVGAVGWAGEFNGSTSMLVAPLHSTNQNLTTNGKYLTIETIIKLPGAIPSASMMIVSKGQDSSTNRGWLVRVDGSTGRLHVYVFTNNNWLRYLSASALPRDQWIHLVCLLASNSDRSKEKIWINGVGVSTTHASNFTGTALTESYPLVIGGQYIDGTPPLIAPMEAQIDSVVGYDYELTNEQVLALAQAAGLA